MLTPRTSVTEPTDPGRRSAPPVLACAGTLLFLLGSGSCRFDPAYRDAPAPAPVPACTVGAEECQGSQLVQCRGDPNSPSYAVVQDCGAKQQVCSPTLLACTACLPTSVGCDGQNVVACNADGQATTTMQTCDTTTGNACRGGECVNLCSQADQDHSNIGCEYWPVDLDNADISPSLNAAAQQYAVVVSNVQPDVPALVTVEEDDSSPGSPPQIRTVGSATIAPLNLEVFNLGPREVDGSADGTFNTGTGTALTRHAYRLSSSVPIVAYQFNPLDNVNVFSNDASQLLPTSALSGSGGSSYVVTSWPQTIAITSDPNTNFGLNLRAFLAIVGTAPNTHVHVKTMARVIPGGPFASGIPAGAQADAVIDAYDVLNLETGDFDADFTGSLVTADAPIVVYPGSEASDAPFYSSISQRYCCADHLEQQLPPVRAVGKSYVLARMPNRSRAVIAAGGAISPYDEPEYFRVVAVSEGTTHVVTTLPPPNDKFDLPGLGSFVTITVQQDFTLTASGGVIVDDTQSGQDGAGVPRGLPGGDPSLLFVAPVEQWRDDYVLLTPNKYVFDYIVIAAPAAAHVFLDGMALGPDVCDIAPVDDASDVARGALTPPYLAYRCQLSYPVIDSMAAPPNNILPGKQNDGVHHVQADLPVGVIAYGFDSYVSYAYAGGTQLTDLSVK
jgi:hypothetical protein